MQPGVAVLLRNVGAKAGPRFPPIVRTPIISVAVLDIEVIGVIADVVLRRHDWCRFGIFAFYHRIIQPSFSRDGLGSRRISLNASMPSILKQPATLAGRPRASNGVLPESSLSALMARGLRRLRTGRRGDRLGPDWPGRADSAWSWSRCRPGVPGLGNRCHPAA